ncbi:hypothetical protein Taro_000355, partial [Colocasia esculenta]|nr:hypothetical protein [Colocasia esculenta]
YMASRGRCGGVPAHDGEQRRDEPRREDQGEQQSPAPQGPVLPPPLPVDYGVFMQGIVQAIQTQTHTQAALQAQLEAQAQVPAPQADHGGPSIMERFKRMSPPSFKREGDPLLAESWVREIEKIFRAITCIEDDKVTLATYMLQERANVWWSSLLRTQFEDGAVEALSAACRQEGEMEQYLEEKKASQKRPAAPFQRQERKNAAFQSPQHPVLEEHYALVDYRGKKIVFRIPGEDEFSHPLPRNLAGKFVISAMKGMRMVNKGCDAFLISVASTSVDADPKSAATLMDANPILTASDLDVYLPDQMGLQIQKRLRICLPLIRKLFPNGNLAYPLCISYP